MSRKKRTFVCAECGGRFAYISDGSWGDAQARSEAKGNGFTGNNLAIVCDPCYRRIAHRHGLRVDP